jgi:competence protein ComGC
MSEPNKKSVNMKIVVTVIVCLFVGFLAFAIPNFIKARSVTNSNGCINNLRQIEGAKEQWALEARAKPGDVALTSEIAAYIKGGLPACPQGGAYTIGRVGEHPKCSFPGHSL